MNPNLVIPIVENNPEPAENNDVKFCLNCDDMDDLAVSRQAEDLEAARRRFQNCDEIGKFDGDVCSRLFVMEQNDDPSPLFDEV